MTAFIGELHRTFREVAQVLDRRDRERVDPAGDPEVHRGVVQQLHGRGQPQQRVAPSIVISETSMPRPSASDAAAVRSAPRRDAPRPGRRAARAAAIAPSAATVRPGQRRRLGELSRTAASAPPKSSAAGKAGSGGGAYGPSNVATWSYPAAGSTPTSAGYLAFAASCDANRRAAAAATRRPAPDHREPPDQVERERLGRVDERFAGRAALVRDVLHGGRRRLVACRPRRAPRRAWAGHQQRHGQRPRHRPGRPDRESTGMNVPLARCASSCSGEPGAPTPTSSQPRRAASVASASGSAVCPDLDAAITRSAAPTQPGSW